MKEKIAIICPANYPVPSVKGGAIETLIEIFIKENEIYGQYDIILYSYHNNEAVLQSKIYKNTKFIFFKEKKIIKNLHSLTRKVVRKGLKIDLNSLFMSKVIKDIKIKNINKILIEGNINQVIPIKKSLIKSDIYLHIHHDAFNYYNPNNRMIANCCKKIITVSDYIKQRTYENLHLDSNLCKIETLKNCTDIRRFNKSLYINERNKLRMKYGIEDSEVLILFSGRILEIKGVRELILAFKKYCLDLNAKLMIVGNAGFANSIQDNYDRELLEISSDIGNKIIFTGFIHNSILPKIHAMAEIAVVPSIWDEPAGLVVIEALSSGIPVIVTDSGGIPEYINNKCSIVIERDENLIDNIGKALVELINNKKKREDMSLEARKCASKFNTEKYYKDLIKILK